jgi:hypothetical protein
VISLAVISNYLSILIMPGLAKSISTAMLLGAATASINTQECLKGDMSNTGGQSVMAYWSNWPLRATKPRMNRMKLSTSEMGSRQ